MANIRKMGKVVVGENVFIYDGYIKGNQSYPLTTCPSCGKEHRVSPATISGARKNPGRVCVCKECKPRATRRKDIEICENGAHINWNNRDEKSRIYITYACGHKRYLDNTRVAALRRLPVGDCSKCIKEKRDGFFSSRAGHVVEVEPGKERVSIKTGEVLIHQSLVPEEYKFLTDYLFNQEKYAYEHFYIAVKSLGRVLRDVEAVEHINGIVGDNRLENLAIVNYFQPQEFIEAMQARIRELECDGK